ncbi:MAG: energy transducer TonB [Deltaproteobacteria bacterium]|nr:energy transducer TonB [Deltaproteobacteria bacterium]
MAVKADQKILRIGIIQSGKIIEERLLRKREAITVGESTKNTFSLPIPGLGKRYTLFPMKGGKYELAFTEKMQGKITSKGGGVVDLQSLKSQKLVRKKGGVFYYSLTPDTRGKIQIGEVIFLFQFVKPPPLPAKPKLPAVARGGLIRSIDWVFATIVVISFLAHTGVIAYAKSQPKPPEPTLEDLGERFMRVIMPKKPKKKPKVEKPGGKKGGTKARKKTKNKSKKEGEAGKKAGGKKKAMSAEEAARAAAQRRAELRKKMASKGVLGILGSLGGGRNSNGMKVADVFGTGHITGDLDAAFRDVSGVDIASEGGARTSRGGGGAAGDGQIANIASLKASGVSGGGGLGRKKAATVRGSIKSAAPEIDGALDSGALQRAVRRKMSAVKACYEKQLKRNPNLSGKIVIYFVVGGNGRVTEASIEQNTMGNKEVAACILVKIKRWIFPKPEDGEEAPVTIPFVFAPVK